MQSAASGSPQISGSKVAVLALAMAAVLIAVAYVLFERGPEPVADGIPVVAEPARPADPPAASSPRRSEAAPTIVQPPPVPKSEGGKAVRPEDDLVAQLQTENAQLREEVKRLLAQLQADNAQLRKEVKQRMTVTEKLSAGLTDTEADALIRRHLERILDSPDAGFADWSLECRGAVCKVEVTALDPPGGNAHRLLQKDAELSQVTRGFAVRPGHEGGPLREEMYLLLRTPDAGP